jgi:hypothetical protein
MIQLADKLYLRIDVGNLPDIIDSDGVVNIVMQEELGNKLPLASMDISLPLELHSLVGNELTTVTVFLGYNEEYSTISKWQVAGFQEIDDTLRLQLTINRDYLEKPKFKIYKQRDSISTIKSVVEEYFGTILPDGKSSAIQVSNFNDKMDWIQYGIPCRQFVDEIWLHSYKQNCLLLPGISANIYEQKKDNFGTFRLVDVSDRSNAIAIHWEEEKENLKGVELIDDGLYGSQSGLFNYQIGNKKLTQFNQNTQENIDEEIELNPIFNAQNRAEFNAASMRTYSEHTRTLGSNVHKNFHKAAKLNINHISRLSGFTKVITIADRQGVIIGDIIRLISWIPGSTAADPVESGDYIVAGTITNIRYDDQVQGWGKTLILRKDALDIQDYRKVITS